MHDGFPLFSDPNQEGEPESRRAQHSFDMQAGTFMTDGN